MTPGSKCRIACGNERNAQIELAQRHQALRNGTYRLKYDEKGRVRGTSSTPFSEIAETLFEQRSEDRDWSQAYQRNYHYVLLGHLIPAFGNRRLADISKIDLERYKRARKKKVKGPTVNRELALLSGLLQVAVESEFLAVNPVRGIRRYKENESAWQYLDTAEADRLLRACDDRLRPIVLCALYTGMRTSEIQRLIWDDVDLVGETLWVPRSKGGTPRDISLHPILKAELERLRKSRRSEYVFTKKNGAQHKDWRAAWARAKGNAGFPNLRFHDLRHTFASWHTQAGTHPFELQELLGHRTLTMTRRYSHVTTEAKRKAMNNLPDVSKPGKIGEIAPTHAPTRVRGTGKS